MPPSPWNPSSAYLTNDPSAHAQAPATSHTPPRARPAPAHEAHQAPAFSAAQRSAQARGKPFDPPNPASRLKAHPLFSSTSSSSSPAGTSSVAPSTPESFAARERRLEAAVILDSTEMLMWYASARHESVAQTRRYYTNIVMGLPDDEVVWREEWEAVGDGVAGRSPAKGAKGKGKERERERERKSTPRKREREGQGQASDV